VIGVGPTVLVLYYDGPIHIHLRHRDVGSAPTDVVFALDLLNLDSDSGRQEFYVVD